MKVHILYTLCLVIIQATFSQEKDVLSFSEYLGYVKKHHPIVKQSHLLISESEAKLLKARGSFDPKLEVDYDRKKFKNTEYFDKLNATFKIPTWYGLELKGRFEQNSGEYINPEGNTPNNGLYNVGVSVSLAKGLLINKRMATIKQAKLYRKQAAEDNQLLVNKILYKASKSYFKWLKTHQEKTVYEEFLNNAKLRLQGIKKSYQLGEKPAIDTTEANIAFNNRKLSLEKSKLNYIKASLELSNFLWINDIPVEIQTNIIPDTQIANHIDSAFQIDNIILDQENHPKLKSLGYKFKGLKVERHLNRNNLLPRIDLQYNFLNETPEIINTFNTLNYKAGLTISFPIFLRKERAELKLTNYKLQAVNFDRQIASLEIKNNLKTVQQEISSYQNQIAIAANMVSDYTILLKGEERKFNIGESSLFLINSRESKLIQNKLKVIELEYSLLIAKGKLFNTLGITSI